MRNITSRNIGIGIVSLTGALLLLLLCVRAFSDHSPHVDVDRSRYPVRGVDLSSHNGRVDFDSLAEAGIDFVFVKASEGEDFRDASYAANYAGARRTGIAVGAYHFFRFDRDGRRQARNFLDAIEGCHLDLPLVIDIEESGNPGGAPTDMICSHLASMVAMLQAEGHKVLIYTNKNGDARFMRGRFDDISHGDPELWICSFTDPPLTRRPWLFWQHSHCSKVPGVRGKVDLNTFNGDRDAWHTWLEGHRSTIKSDSIR